MSRKKIGWLFCFLAFALIADASIIKFPPTKTEDLAYNDLVCTEQDKANIYEIIVTMAEKPKLKLLFIQDHLKQIGAQINHVHPLRFLGTIFSNSRLKESMFTIFDDYFKRNGFMDGLGPSLTNEAEKGKLDQYLNDFSMEVNASPNEIHPHFKSRDWESLVRYLMQQP
jgi:hypothetical protein